MNKQIIIALIVGLFLGGSVTFGVLSTNTQKMAMNQNTNSMSQNPNSNESMNSMNHTNISMDQMSMSDMMTELDGKTGDEFDRTFIQAMIAHHQGAIDMANMAKQNALHQEIKDMADDIISAQTTEINQMSQWQKEWGYTQ